MTGLNPTSELDDVCTLGPERSLFQRTFLMREFVQVTSIEGKLGRHYLELQERD